MTQVPVAPWQIPASRIPNKTEHVADLETEQWGTGGTYIFGDVNINSDYRNTHPTILALKIKGNVIPYEDVEELFASVTTFNLSSPVYSSFPARGIFTVLLGGGSTTGIITTVGTTGPWTQEKVCDYMQDPIRFDSTSSSHSSSAKSIVGKFKQQILGRI